MNRNRWMLVVIIVLVVAAIAVGVSQRDDASISTSARDATASSAASGSSESSAAASADDSADDSESSSGDQRKLPAFEGELFGGGTLASSDIKGPAVIHVYASWCSTCQGEAPAFAKLQQEHPDLNYYNIAVEDEEGATNAFVEEFGWKQTPTIDDSSREVEQAFGLSGQPHTIFVAADGAITIHQGPGEFDELDRLAQQIE